MASPTEIAEKALDKVRPPKAPKVPPGIEERLKHGRDRLNRVIARREEAIEFAANNHYVSINKSGTGLNSQDTVSVVAGGDKPDHRVRRSHDLLAPIIKGKVSAATQRIPAYEILPATSDPEDYAASRTAKNVAAAGYELWDLKEAFRKLVWNALVTEEGFIMPFWDSSVGPYVTDPDDPTRRIGMGEIKAAVFGGLEVIWEPGVRYEESSWCAIEHARPKGAVEAEEGFMGEPLKGDADSKGTGKTRRNGETTNLVMVTEYLERPCPKYPDGRRLIFANGRQIFAEEKYPLRDHEGNTVDAPCLHRLYYTIDGDSDRDRGLVPSLVESMRSYDYASNKAQEHLQLVLIAQMMAPEGAITGEVTDQPGAIIEYNPEDMVGGEIKWRDMPSMPQEFSSERDRAEAELRGIALDNQVPATAADNSKAVSVLLQKDAIAWQDFIEDLAKVHSRFMRDALCLVQYYYTEDRLVKFRGRTGWEAIADFKGADIRGQTDVRVNPGSLEPLTRPAIEQRIMNLNQMFPGLFPPEVIIGALNAGDADRLNQSYEEDEARINFIIGQIRSGAFWDLPDRPVFPGEEAPRLNEQGEPELDLTGQVVMEETLPGWMPRPFDGVPVHKLRIETFMKSDEWNYLDPDKQQAAIHYYRALLDLEKANANREAELTSANAEKLGMENAAKPQQPKPMPSLPSVTGEGEGEQTS